MAQRLLRPRLQGQSRGGGLGGQESSRSGRHRRGAPDPVPVTLRRVRAAPQFAIRPGTAADLERVVEIKVGSWSDTCGSLIEPAVLRPFLERDRQLADFGFELLFLD